MYRQGLYYCARASATGVVSWGIINNVFWGLLAAMWVAVYVSYHLYCRVATKALPLKDAYTCYDVLGMLTNCLS